MRAGGWCDRGMLERPARGRYGASRVPSTIAPIRASLSRAPRHSSPPRALPREPQQSGEGGGRDENESEAESGGEGVRRGGEERGGEGERGEGEKESEASKGRGVVGKKRGGAKNQSGNEEREGEEREQEARPVWAGDQAARQQVLSKPPGKWRTALCLVGGARDFELTWPSILTRLLPTLPSPSLFLHSPLDENAFKLWSAVWAKKKWLAGVRVFASTWVNGTEYGGGTVLHDQYSPQGDQGMLQYLRLVEGCVPLIQAYETRHAMRFDWVVRSRVDTFWAKPPPVLRDFEVDKYTIPWGTDCMGLNDRFGAGTWETSAPALHRLSMLHDLGRRGYRNLNSESGFKAQLEVANVSLGRADLPFCVMSRRVYPHSMMPVAALSSSAPLNGAKCRPCVPSHTGYETVHRLHYFAPMSHIGRPLRNQRLYGRGIDLCNEREPWASNWTAVFDATVGEKLGAMRRAIMAVQEDVKECTRSFAQMTRVAEAWQGPAAEAMCVRMSLGPMVKVGGLGRSFPTALQPLSNASQVFAMSEGADDTAWESAMEESVSGLSVKHLGHLPASPTSPMDILKLSLTGAHLASVQQWVVKRAPPPICQLLLAFPDAAGGARLREKYVTGLAKIGFHLAECVQEDQAPVDRCCFFSSTHCF
ncbi:unnamed protein product [Closterium sp. Naga37s-1]|nr:unnamed protein product [Closterium sp. Naga37s-1]